MGWGNRAGEDLGPPYKLMIPVLLWVRAKQFYITTI